MNDEPILPGYKRTAVGIIPKDWDLCTFGKLVNIRNNKVNPALVDPSTPCVELENIGQGTGHLIGYSLAEQSTSTKYRFIKKDVLFGRLRAYLRKFWLAEFDGICTTEIWPLKPVDDQIRNEFLFQVVQTDRFNEAASVAYGTHMPRADWGVISNLSIPLPDPAEQTAIAEVLSDVDALLEALDRLIAKKRDIKLGAMQALLTGRVRLPGFERQPGYKRTEVGVIPVDWEVKRLDEIADVDPENLGARTDPDYSFRYISLEDVDYGTLRSYTEQVFRTAPSRARRVIRKGDILVSTVRPNLKSHLYIKWDAIDSVCSTGFSVLRCKPCVADPALVFFHLFGGTIERQIESLLTGSNYPAINSNDVKTLQIPFPPNGMEQTAIAEVLSDMDAEIEALEKRHAKLRAIKQGMMQELLTGRTRLIQPQKQAQEVNA